MVVEPLCAAQSHNVGSNKLNFARYVDNGYDSCVAQKKDMLKSDSMAAYIDEDGHGSRRWQGEFVTRVIPPKPLQPALQPEVTENTIDKREQKQLAGPNLSGTW